MQPVATTAMSAEEVSRTVRRMSHELLELNSGPSDLVLLGVLTRGVPLAHRMAAQLAAAEGLDVPVGELDITMYRDDLHRNPSRPVGRTKIPGSINDRVIVLVDDVLFSGRTIQAALHALGDLGRPREIQLVALVDRGHRQLPIQANIVGQQLFTAHDERVSVRMAELDGIDEVSIQAPELARA